MAELPADKEIHVILDNNSTHKRNEEWLAKYERRVIFHFTPTSASWLNQVEIWFSLLTRKALNGASFKGKTLLRDAIEAFIANTNRNPRPFRWRKREVKGSQLLSTLINLCNSAPEDLSGDRMLFLGYDEHGILAVTCSEIRLTGSRRHHGSRLH